MIAATFCHPIDTYRVKMQMQKPLYDGSMKYTGLMSGLKKIGAEEGVGLSGIYKGYAGTVGLHSSYSMVRYGTYEPIKRLYGAEDPNNTPIWKKFAAGGTAGFIAAGFACPVDLIKTRM